MENRIKEKTIGKKLQNKKKQFFSFPSLFVNFHHEFN